MPGFSAYIHLPYCVRRCPYCDFNTYAVRNIPEDRYIAAVQQEIEASRELGAWKGRSVDTVFFGGGTPSLFSPKSFALILETLEHCFGIAEDAEISMEANPGTLEGSAYERLQGWREAGLNRLSLGVQSFHDKQLATLGRLHNSSDVVDAISAARQAGFENVSLDLIFAVPGQTREQWRDDLAQALDLGTDHISAYGLTFEPGTPMTGLRDAGRVRPAPEELELSMLEDSCRLLGDAGFERYEISNFAKPGKPSRHNLAYWLRDDYLGLGAGAHGFCDDRSGQAGASGGQRYANRRFPEIYMSSKPGQHADSRETLSRGDAIGETVLLGMRLLAGLDTDRFEARFGENLRRALPRLEAMADAGLVVEEATCVRLSEKGLLLADSVISELCTETA